MFEIALGVICIPLTIKIYYKTIVACKHMMQPLLDTLSNIENTCMI